jgi:hypothetical protein
MREDDELDEDEDLEDEDGQAIPSLLAGGSTQKVRRTKAPARSAMGAVFDAVTRHGPSTSAEIVKLTGLSMKTASSRLSMLAASGRLTKTPGPDGRIRYGAARDELSATRERLARKQPTRRASRKATPPPPRRAPLRCPGRATWSRSSGGRKSNSNVSLSA